MLPYQEALPLTISLLCHLQALRSRLNVNVSRQNLARMSVTHLSLIASIVLLMLISILVLALFVVKQALHHVLVLCVWVLKLCLQRWK